MEKFYLFFMKIMIWGTIPLVFLIECWEQALNMPETRQVFFQIIILLVTLKWVLFWNGRLTEFELEIFYRDWDSHRDYIKKR